MRLRRDEAPTPEVAADLAAIDAALAGEQVADEQLELAALALAVRAERAVPDEGSAASLDSKVEAALRRPSGRQRIRVPMPSLGRAPLALGTAACAFILAIAVLSGVLGGEGDESSGPTERPGVTAAPWKDATRGARSGDSGASAGAPEAALAVPFSKGADVAAPRAGERKVERSAQLSLAPERREVDEVADGVIRTTDRLGGFVVSSSVSSGGNRTGATFDLRVPTARLPQAVADLSELAHVRSRTENALDITARFASPRRRLADATAERRGLLRQLATADTANETASVRIRLRAANGRIDRARAQLRRLQNRVSYAAVSVDVQPRRGSRGSGAAGAWSPGDALDDALSVLGTSVGIALVATAVLLPLSLLVAALWGGNRLFVRRRRNRALDA
jgi:Domain of unknown function (DUF4349)